MLGRTAFFICFGKTGRKRMERKQIDPDGLDTRRDTEKKRRKK